MRHTLEHHRFFSAVAWVLILGFAAFVYFLTVEFTQTTSALETTRDEKKAALEGDVRSAPIPD